MRQFTIPHQFPRARQQAYAHAHAHSCGNVHVHAPTLIPTRMSPCSPSRWPCPRPGPCPRARQYHACHAQAQAHAHAHANKPMLTPTPTPATTHPLACTPHKNSLWLPVIVCNMCAMADGFDFRNDYCGILLMRGGLLKYPLPPRRLTFG